MGHARGLPDPRRNCRRSGVDQCPPVQFRHGDFQRRLGEIVRAAGVDPSRLELEITENVLIDDDRRALQLLHELKRDGFSIALDDFGTGYSSLSYLSRYPFDAIKIDRSFVSNLGEDESAAAIVHAIIDLGTRLGMRVVAEGVETERRCSWRARAATSCRAICSARRCPPPRWRACCRMTPVRCGRLSSRLAQREMRAAERHRGAEAQRRQAGEHARDRRDRAGRGGRLAGAGQHQHADGDQELPHPLRNLAGYRAVHQGRGEIAAGEADGRDQPPCDRPRPPA